MKTVSISLALLMTLLLTGCSGGTLDSFAQCITDAGATKYGTEWCSHCKAQKELFGNSFNKVNYVDCDKDKDTCLIAKIPGYPTWVFADESRLSGTQSLETLAAKTKCTLPVSNK